MVKPAHAQLRFKIFTHIHTISLFVVLHEQEWIEVKVAKEGDVGPERNNKE